MSLGQSQDRPKPGDLLEFPRPGYQHWGVYVGDDEIIHLAGTGNSNISTASISLGSASTTKAEVKKEKLQDVMGNNKPKINNKLDAKYKPRPVRTILQNAEALVGRKVEYNLITLNCEHFANALRYGQPESRQVQNAAQTAWTVGGIGTAAAIIGAGVTWLFGSNRNRNQ